MKAFESASGESLDEDKKELASEELITTGDLGEDIGQDQATGIINDIKTEVIKNGTSDVTQIADTINNVTNNYNVTLTDAQVKQITDLMEKIAAQNYDYNEMKDTLNGIKDTVNDKLEQQGVKIDKGFFDSIKDWFSSIGDWFSGLFGNNKDLGILNNTDDSILGSDAKIDATDESAINLPSNEEVEGFFEKIWNWFTGLFNNSNDDSNTENNSSNEITNSSNTDSNNNSSLDDSVNKLEENSTTDKNVQSDSVTNYESENQDSSNELNSSSQNTNDSENNTN